MAFKTNKVPAIEERTVSGSSVSFNSAFALPLKACKVSFSATQASGTPSPDNPRSISGWSKIRIGQLGNSPLNSYFEGLYNGTYGFVDLGSLNWTYQTTYKYMYARLSGGKYTNLSVGLNGLCSLYEVDSTNSYSSLPDKCMSVGSDFVSTNVCAVVVHDSEYTDANAFKTAMNGVYLIYELKTPTPTITDTQFDTLLTAFGVSGSMFTIQIGSTVYGGEYDARTGVFTVTHKYLSFDYTSPWAFEISSVGRNFYLACPSDIKINQYAWTSTLICSASPISTRQGAEKDHCFISASRNFNFSWGETLDISTAQGFRDYLQANNLIIEVVAELATSTTIQLPPCPIDTLEGVNNIWADTGDIDLTYKDLDIAKRGNFREVFKLPS